MNRIPDPVVDKADGRTRVATTILLDFYAAGRTACALVKAFMECQREITIRRTRKVPGQFDGPVSLRSAMGVLALCLRQGDEVEVCVEGEDSEAERIAKRAYAALTSADCDCMELDRYERAKANGKPGAHC